MRSSLPPPKLNKASPGAHNASAPFSSKMTLLSIARLVANARAAGRFVQLLRQLRLRQAVVLRQ